MAGSTAIARVGIGVSTMRSTAAPVAERLATHIRTPMYGRAYALILSSGLTAVLGIAYWTIAARLYPAEAVGLDAAAIATMTFLAFVAQLNLGSALARFLPTAGAATRRLITSAYLVAAALSGIAALIFLAGTGTWAPDQGWLTETPSLAAWFVIATMGWSLFALQDSALAGLRRAAWVPIENGVFAVSKIALLVVFALAMPGHGILLSWTIPAVLLLIPVNVLIFRRFAPEPSAQRGAAGTEITPGRLTAYLAGDYVGTIAQAAAIGILPLLILATLGSAMNAYYYVAWTVAYALMLVSTNAGISHVVEGAGSVASAASSAKHMLALLLKLQVPAVAGIVLLAPLILELFGGAYADEGTLLLRLLTLAVLPHAINTIYLSLARVRRQARRVALVQASIAAFCFGLSVALLPAIGIAAVGVGWLVGQTAVAAILLVTQLLPAWRGVELDGRADGADPR